MNIIKLCASVFAFLSYATYVNATNFSALPKLSDWPRHGQDITNNQQNLLSDIKISKANSMLERCRINYVRGSISQGSVESYSAQHIIVNDVVYWTGFGGQVGATKLIRDKKDQVVSCQDLWVKDVSTELGVPSAGAEPAARVSPAYFIQKNGKPALLYTGVASAFTLPSVIDAFNTPVYAFALDASTGQKIFQVAIGDPGIYDPDNSFANATSSPIVYNNVAYFGVSSFNKVFYADFFGGYPLTFRGQIVALDLLGIGNNGQPFVKWKQYTIPQKPANWTGPWFLILFIHQN